MTCTAFEAALKEEENDASNTRLYALIESGDYSGNDLLNIAEDYLEAFCSPASTHVRRRWIGMALLGMLNASHEVAKHLQVEKWRLQKLGDIILRPSEREETKIVAGVVMRQALEDGIEFLSFWASDKVRHSVPNFPKEHGPRWIKAFQDFIDALSNLALANSVTDASILYPVSVMASDGFRWASSNDSVPIYIVQEGSLVVLLSEDFRRDIQFLDVPVAHIKSTKTRPSTSLYDSQSQMTVTGHEPWDVILTLEHDHWTYCLDTTNRTATEVTILLEDSANARECHKSITELLGTGNATPRPTRHPRMSRSTPIDISSSPSPKTDGSTTQGRQAKTTEAVKLSARHHAQPTARHSSSAITSRQQERTRPDMNPVQSSSDELGHSSNGEVDLPRQSLHNAPAAKSREQAHQAPDTVHSTKKQQSLRLARGRNETNATKKVFQVDGAQKYGNGVPEQSSKDTKSLHTKRQKEGGRIQAQATPTYVTATRPSTRSTQPGSSAEPVNASTSPTESLPGEGTTAKQTANSEGKLPKVSQAIKQRAQQLRKQPDVFDIPAAERNKPPTKLPAVSQTRKTRTATRASPVASQGKRTRGNRKLGDDDADFVPNTTKVAKKAVAKRKAAPFDTVTSKPVKKRPKKDSGRTGRRVQCTTECSSDQAEARQAEKAQSDKPHNHSTSRGPQSNTVKRSPTFVASLRTPLIGGLLGTHKPAQISKNAFKKPALPTRAPHAPSTPSRPPPKATVQGSGPRTPIEGRKPSNTTLPLTSSPPSAILVDHDFATVQHGTADKETLSSNSKPTPASPHAESTAISGHADRDEVDLEKQKGDLQVARSDPFQQRRVHHTATSFTRRLTGDSLLDRTGSIEDLSHTLPDEIDIMVSSDTEDLLVKAASQPLPLPKLRHVRKPSVPRAGKSFSQPLAQPVTQKTVTRAEVHRTEIPHVTDQLDEERPVPTSKTLKRKSIFEEFGSNDTPREKRAGSARSAASLECSITKLPNIKPAQTQEKAATVPEDSVLTAPPQDIDNTQIEHIVEAQNDFNEDGDTTLVNDDSEEQLPIHPKGSSPHFPSSPPGPGSSSSHSSTSAASEPSSPHAIPTPDAEEMQWEATLEPHQRALHDLLIRVSKRVTRHVVDSETAVTDIAEVFESDGEHLLEGFLQRHKSVYEGLWEDMETKTTRLKKEMESSVRALAKERKRVNFTG
ncbi:hypothetical protein CC86DRAFT_366073 [Ophiobolus disseminans]|uniref:Uncharacterized protein n=1 Tax=Ophiobolus disseminans TaxID=1469910 RepID=A0A6A7AFW5_9PLEO|nr:hypothetical protein CC86DRAFT_366073 [Ophiobolus disseminans]